MMGEQGVYYVTPLNTLRMPFNEIIDVYNTPPNDMPKNTLYREQGTLFARHRMWFFGYPFLTLYYTIWQA